MTSTSYPLRQNGGLFATLFAMFSAFFDDVAAVTARNGNIEPFGL
ncbi:MAG: hypothetical protein ACTHM2_20920 [Afipia sp.]|jgi:hypothetical protein